MHFWMMVMLFAERGKAKDGAFFFLFVGGGSKWFALYQGGFEFSVCHSNEDVGQAVGDRYLELRVIFKCGDHT